MTKKSSGAGSASTLMKTKSSEAGIGAMFMTKIIPETKQEQCHCYDGPAALNKIIKKSIKEST